MTIDINSFVGSWNTHPVKGRPDWVWETLRGFGVERIYASPLEAAWCKNPHRLNDPLYQVALSTDDVSPVPVIDPTVSTWPKELTRAEKEERVHLVRLQPAYSQYELSAADACLSAIGNAGLGVIVQTRLEDPRRQHPLAQVPDVSPASIADAAERHSNLTMIVGGPRGGEIRSLKDRLLGLPNLYADVSQADGMDALQVMVEQDGLVKKLLFGSHAPLFIPHAAFARVATDLGASAAEAILRGNALGILG